MLKYFRKIRQQLLSENRISRYLLYAIGEIVLVVIGILLALQINSWNQDAQNRKTEKEYYQRLLADVLLDEELIATQIEFTKERLEGANVLLRELQRGNENMEDIASAILRCVSMSNYGITPTQTTFEDIKSSGNIRILKDLDLRKELDNYYVFMDGLCATINHNSTRLGQRMLEKENVIGTGHYHLSKNQNGLNPEIVDIQNLDRLSRLNDENRLVLMNDAVYYSSISSRNLHHFQTLLTRVVDMKKSLKDKCNE